MFPLQTPAASLVPSLEEVMPRQFFVLPTDVSGAKGIAVLPLFPIFRPFFHFHKNLSSSVISGTFSRENRFPPKPKKRPKIAKHTKHEALPKRDAILANFH
jgi:hypothetical protein